MPGRGRSGACAMAPLTTASEALASPAGPPSAVAAASATCHPELPPLPARDPVTGLPIPTLHDVFRARTVVDRFLARTPLLSPPALAERLGCDVYVKCESLQPIGAFKVRGGIYLLSQLSRAERAR